jgi:hypothetical protein
MSFCQFVPNGKKTATILRSAGYFLEEFKGPQFGAKEVITRRHGR